jgi:hypothetical protein
MKEIAPLPAFSQSQRMNDCYNIKVSMIATLSEQLGFFL